MLNIGINSYVDLEEADIYIEDNYLELDNLSVIWGVLTDKEKEVYLIQSAGEIDTLLLMGVKYAKNQKMEFPRMECYKQGKEIPNEVKEAQIENALSIMSKSVSARSDEQMKILNSLGAYKNLKYNKREMGEIGLGESLTGQNTSANKRLTSLEAEKILKAWIG